MVKKNEENDNGRYTEVSEAPSKHSKKNAVNLVDCFQKHIPIRMEGNVCAQ